MKIIITRPLTQTSKDVIIATAESIQFYLEQLHEQTGPNFTKEDTIFTTNYLLTEVWKRVKFLENVYDVIIKKD